MKKFETRVYSISDFLEWEKTGLLDLSPDFQRRGVWAKSAKSFLIDTIVRGKPMPKVIITQALKGQRNLRTVVDGQQRLRTIFEFVAGELTLLKAHNEEFARKRFEDFPEEIQSSILKYEVGVDVLYDAATSELLDIFARINTYSVVLNKQEKLNAKYVGAFKTFAYELGHAYVDYFESSEILTRKDVSRMGEASLSSDLLMAICDKIQTNKNVERLYEKYEDGSEDSLDELFIARSNFNKTMSWVGSIYPPSLIKNSNWSKVHMFYTLFTVVGHALFCIKPLKPTPKLALTNKTLPVWRSVLGEISSDMEKFSKEVDRKEISPALRRFLDFSEKRTTDSESRTQRANYVIERLNRAL